MQALERAPRTAIRAELRDLLAIAIPAGITSACRLLVDLENTVVIGHIASATGTPTALYLDAASLAALCFNLIFACFGRSCDGVMTTLVSQAFGARNTHLVGSTLLSGLCAYSLALIMTSGLLAFAPIVLRLVVHDPPATSLAGRYCLISIGSLAPSYGAWCLSVWLLGQRVATPE